jgi:D-alanyl-lipoteichoic acid acyltransferase DltB (MBOAT superfamily)
VNFDLEKIFDQFRYHETSPLLFTSGFFLFFFLVLMGGYQLLLRQQNARLVWVTLLSLYFYYKCAGIFWILHVVIVIVDFHLARQIEKAERPSNKRWLLIGSLSLNLGMLVYFKYTNYFAELWNAALGGNLGPYDIFLPAGISFFTFQSLSYTLDVYRGQLKALDSMLDYAFFVTFFPQMVAGPIVRAADFLPQIHRFPYVDRAAFGRGVFLICAGLFKKAVISDYISANFVDRVFDSPLQYSGMENLFAVYGYAMQIYCDFSGYSDMAIGLALLMGFQFPPNFNAPYQAASITEFWRRWHISLSTWLRDYLYIPLGGNRKGKLRTYFNLFLTMLLGGLWHGAATRFLIWGALHGLALGVEKAFKEIVPTPPGVIRKVLGVLLTFHFVCFCWIFFRAADLQLAGQMITQIGWHFQPGIFPEFFAGYAKIIFWIALGYALHILPVGVDNFIQQKITALPLAFKAFAILCIAALVMQVKSAAVQPFIYFQF